MYETDCYDTNGRTSYKHTFLRVSAALLPRDKVGQVFGHLCCFFANGPYPLFRERKAILEVKRKNEEISRGRTKQLTVPVSRRCAANEYFTPVLLYTQSMMLPGALAKVIKVKRGRVARETLHRPI